MRISDAPARILATVLSLGISLHGAVATAQAIVAPSAPQISAGESDSLPIRPGDVIAVHVFDDTDLDQAHMRVTDQGTVPLLLIGATKVSGMTPGEAAEAISRAYVQKNILINAHVSVTTESISSSDVTVIGYVNGISGQTFGSAFPLTVSKPLLTVLAMAGGLSEHASRTITIQRGGPHGPRVTVTLPISADADLDNDPMVNPGDIVVVPRAGYVYILGNVGHPQAVVMNEDGHITLLQALSQAGSTLPTAALKRVMVFRKTGGQYVALPINVGEIYKGKQQDIALQAEDAVWVGFSYGKNLLVNGASIAAAVGGATASGIIYTH